MDDDFLLHSPTARTLYHSYAEGMPIFDFHCHLSAADIRRDRVFGTLTELWLESDHYKWRLLREFGVEEKYVTGDASDWEKFEKYAAMMPYAIANPIYHWTHLELRRYFGVTEPLSAANAREIWERCNAQLPRLSARTLISMSGVKTLYTTDDPIDDLLDHEALAADVSWDVRVAPAFRPDRMLNPTLPAFSDYIAALSRASGVTVGDVDTLERAVEARLAYFAAHGCVCSDHGIDVVPDAPADRGAADAALRRALAGESLTPAEAAAYRSYLLVYLGRAYARLGWVQQYHIGAMRNNSTRRYAALGPDTGFDAMRDDLVAGPLSRLLDRLDATDELPKTILYCLNPRDNEVLAALKNCFQGGLPAKVQFGSGWWFNDQLDGMRRQMTALSQSGLLSRFVGMLTDSRSFVSYTRHEYFRRLFCDMLGTLVEDGEYPADLETVGEIVRDVCYRNAAAFFVPTPRA